jgi:hypothetical protein
MSLIESITGRVFVIWFLVRDEPRLAGWQSGLFTTTGVPKPARAAFDLPLAQISRSGTRTELWARSAPAPAEGRTSSSACRANGG